MSAWQHYALTAFLEISFLSGAACCVYRAQKNRIYAAFWQLLIFRIASTTVLISELYVRHLHLITAHHAYVVYFFTYWPSFAVDGILVLRVLHEMFRHAVRSMPGVQKMGRPIFFWAIVVSTVLACAAGMTSHSGTEDMVVAAAQVLMRSQSVLALCLVSFLAFASHTLGVSFRSRIFGVTFGLGLMATANLVNSAILTRLPSLASDANLVLEGVYLASIAIWAAYFLQPEPVRRLVAMPVTSPLMRWNEVAQALGNPAGQVAVSYPPSFMTDVFDLVNNVMGPSEWPSGATAVANRPPGPIAS